MGVDVAFHILGPLELVTGDGTARLGGRKQRGVLAILLLHANEVVPVERLADELYAGAPPPTAGGQVRDHVSQVRKLLGTEAGRLETRSPGYVLRVAPEELDAVRFERLVEAATADLAQQQDARAAMRLREALALWRGPALADLADALFAQPAIARLEELRLTALEQRIEADLRLGHDGALVAELEALVAGHPLREQFRAQLMLALYRSGRHAEAVGLYHDGRRALVDELGIEPSAQLRRLASLILRQDSSLEVPSRPARVTPPGDPRNPYKGLHPFGEDDAGDFHGRERLTGDLVARLAVDRFVAVVGPSGSGKSSLVRAGLVPALRAGGIPGSARWTVAVMTPGAHPFEELEAALLRAAADPPSSLLEQLRGDERGLIRAVKRVLPEAGSELLLVVDQLEEVFTLVEEETAQEQFLASVECALRDPRSRLRVVVTLRADFYDRPLAYRSFGDLLRDRVEPVLPLSPDELERAITVPAAGVGVDLEDGLLAMMLADVVAEPGALPLLQYALTELYERRDGATLTRAAYAAIGGISGALAGRADSLYEALDADGQEAVRQLFLRLVTLGDSVETRRRTRRAELDSLDVDQGALARAVDTFGAARLLSFDRERQTQAPTVEVAHEALLSEWRRLRDWVASAREDLLTHRRLAAAAAEWDEAGRDASMLLRGRQLDRFESWAVESELAQTELEHSYLDTSAAARRTERMQEEARQAREVALERRSVHRLRWLVGVLVIAAVVAAGLTVVAFDQSGRSQREARVATARQLAAASVANLDVDPELSILLGLRAVETTGGGSRALPEAVEALHRAVGASRVVQTIRVDAAALAFDPDGGRVATAGASVSVWDTRSGGRLLSLTAPAAPFHDVAFSPNGRLLAGGGDDGSATVWDARSGRRMFVLTSPVRGVSVSGLSFDRSSTLLAADDGIGDIWVWDVAGRRVLRTIGSQAALCGVAFNPDGRHVATGDCGTHFSGSKARVWDVGTGRLTFLSALEYGSIPGVDVSPDGRYLAAASRAREVRIWDLRTRRLVTTLLDDTGEVLSVAFAPGDRVAAAGTDGTARIWDAKSGKLLVALHGHAAPVVDIAFQPRGSRLATASEDGTVRIWDVTPAGSREELTILAHPGGVESAIFNPRGTRILTTGFAEGKAKLWDARSGRLLASYKQYVEPGAAFIGGSGLPTQATETSPDGNLGIDLHESGGTAKVRDGEGNVLATLGDHVQSAAFDHTGSRLAIGDADGTVEIWAIQGRSIVRVRSFAAHKSLIEAIAFSPDGTLLATAGEDGTAKISDVRTGRSVITLTGHTGFLTAVAFSPDGMRLVTGGVDGTVRVYELPVGRLAAIARSRLTRSWSPDECRQYLGGPCPSRP